MGGIPFYWSLLKREFSLAQNIDSLFFNQDAEGLSHEYEQLYASLFNNPRTIYAGSYCIDKEKIWE